MQLQDQEFKTIIKEYAKSSLCLMERAVDPADKTISWGKYDIACVVTAHYEEHYGPGTETGIVLLYTTFSFNVLPEQILCM